MSDEVIRAKLAQLDDFQNQRVVIELDKQVLIDSVLTQEIKSRLSEIDLEFGDKFSAVDANIMKLESEIKSMVLEYGETVKSEHLQAVYQKGRVSWDTKSLDGYAIAHPEISVFRKVSEPSVSLRRKE